MVCIFICIVYIKIYPFKDIFSKNILFYILCFSSSVNVCHQFNVCFVLSEGSVVVLFDVLFRGVLDSETAQEQLVGGLQQGEGGNDGLVIDISSVQVSGNIINIIII